MVELEFTQLIEQIQKEECESQVLEVKAAHEGCPRRLYDTISAFSNQSSGGTLVFGLDESAGFKKVGVYDAQDLQKKVMEYGEQMSPVVRPVFTVIEEGGLVFVSAEIPPVDVADRPCFQTAKGRLKGSYVRVGDADKPMSEYEVYSYEAFRRKYQDDIRPAERDSLSSLNQDVLAEYVRRRRQNRPNLAALPLDRVYEFTGITRDGKVTLAAVLLFGIYPQAFYPQLSIIATSVPGTEIGVLDEQGQRFTDTKRIEGTLTDMLDGGLNFVRANIKVSTAIDPNTGKRIDRPQYPIDAVREALLNALVHRDYSIHTEGMPVQITMYSDRLEIKNPGGLYGRMTVDQLENAQPDTRNPVLVTAMEVMGETENRYLGIPRIRRAMKEMGLPAPVFQDARAEFTICLLNTTAVQQETNSLVAPPEDKKGLLIFCQTPRSRKEIMDYLGIASGQYALKQYLEPLVAAGAIRLSIPEKPRSPKQRYQTAGKN